MGLESSAYRSSGGDSTQTVLGAIRINPFTTSKIVDAHRSLYNSTITTVSTTHQYVKFLPASIEDIKTLETTGETFYDFPLEYEIIELGDFYQDLGLEEYPIWYAVVPDGFSFPNVAYELIDELYLDESDPLLIAESFRLTGNTSAILTDIVYATGARPEDLDGGGTWSIPDEPECLPGYVAVLQIDNSTIPVSWEWVCVEQEPTGPSLNACGCPKYSSIRKPAGCVKVDDTQLSAEGNPSTFLPVRQVKVTIKDNWFKEDETWTDDNGCWRIDKEYQGNARMWITFKNDRAKIRGTTRSWKTIYQWALTVKDYVGRLSGPNFANIEVNYGRWANQGSTAHVYWGAATVNNALHEFHDYAVMDGINPPPNGLDIYVARNQRFGYAFMPSFMGAQLTNYALGSGLTGNSTFIHPFSVLLSVTSAVGIANQFFPDVFIGIDYANSDRAKSLAYHEIAHSSHYMQVGPNYWSELVAAEVAANGHGDQFSNDAGRIAICESWAEYIGGLHYTHRTYGNTNSVPRNWEINLEQTWNEVANHVPVGLHHDLIDDGEPLFFTDPNTGIDFSACNQIAGGCTFVDDRVNGFTNAQLFQSLTRQIITVDQYRQRLLNSQLSNTSNSIEQLNALFGSY